MGGCLPMLVQLPVFLGFYRMLSGAVELRHEPFGFVQDLTMPDHFATIAGFGALNILPILMAIASFIQMAMIPKTGDNTQRMIFMMMPFIFLIFCYNFAAGLSLYWTVSNVFTIFQTWLMNKLPEPELVKANQQKKSKPGFMARLQEKIEAAQNQHQGGESAKKEVAVTDKKKAPELPQIGQSRTKLASEKGSRHTKGKKKRR
jgi:YidC/Oxa1 family membrane protein insertase